MYAITKDNDCYRREWWDGARWVDHLVLAKNFNSRTEAENEARIMIATRPTRNWSVFYVAD